MYVYMLLIVRYLYLKIVILVSFKYLNIALDFVSAYIDIDRAFAIFLKLKRDAMNIDKEKVFKF